jgi:hypothetical protein
MTIQTDGADIQYNCGNGSIDEAIVSDAEGRFRVDGTVALGAGGPAPTEGWPRRAALYRGTVVGGSMVLTVTVFDAAEPIGPFNLRSGDNGHFEFCY